MRTSVLLVAAALAVALVLAAPHHTKIVGGHDDTKPVYGAYVLLTRGRAPAKSVGLAEFQMLVDKAKTMPLNRIWISFFSPTMVYMPGSNTLENTGMTLTDDADLGSKNKMIVFFR
jgi:hypothetical protein